MTDASVARHKSRAREGQITKAITFLLEKCYMMGRLTVVYCNNSFMVTLSNCYTFCYEKRENGQK